MSKTAIFVDGGFYRRVSRMLWGQKSPSERADELYEYCIRHITSPREARVELGKRDLYRLEHVDSNRRRIGCCVSWMQGVRTAYAGETGLHLDIELYPVVEPLDMTNRTL